MRVWFGAAVALSSCTFTTNLAVTDAGPADATADIAADASPSRVHDGLIGLWTFDDPASAPAASDTSGTSAPVALSVVTSSTISAPVFSGGTITASSPARVISDFSTHLPGDCQTAGAVTFELWVTPASAIQGTATEARFVAGIAGSVTARDIAILQSQDHWVAVVRTGPGLDGAPALRSATVATTSAMTHIVVVADATRRTLYVNGEPEAMTAPGGPMAWDLTYRLALFDEPQHARQWLGTLALVAIYDRGLSDAEIQQNFAAGATAE